MRRGLDDVAVVIRDNDWLAPAVPAQHFREDAELLFGMIVAVAGGCGFNSESLTIFEKQQLTATSMAAIFIGWLTSSCVKRFETFTGSHRRVKSG